MAVVFELVALAPRAHRGHHELGERRALAQHCLHLGTKGRPDTDGQDRGRLHPISVSLLRHITDDPSARAYEVETRAEPVIIGSHEAGTPPVDP
jgi:hypothetical protein